MLRKKLFFYIIQNSFTNINSFFRNLTNRFLQIFSVFLLLSTTFLLNACSKTEDDLSKIKNSKRLNVGITYFEPINYYDETGKLVGFDTELCQKICEKMKIKPEFIEIDWESKETELKSNNIDCIWNGMTKTPEREENMTFSKTYLKNKLVLIAKKEKLDKLKTVEDFENINIITEKASPSSEIASNDTLFTKAKKNNIDTQAKAFMEIKSGTSDVTICDYMMAITYIKSKDFNFLGVSDHKNFKEEEIAIAFRKDSSLAPEINKQLNEMINNGELKQLAEKYGVVELLYE